MQQLIKVTVNNDRQLVSARDLHRKLQIKKRFSVWVKQNFRDFAEGQDFTTVPEGTVVKSGNGTIRKYDDYALTIDMAKELCMMTHSVLGHKFRQYFIEIEKKWNDPKAIIKRHAELLGHMTSDELAFKHQELDFKKHWLSQMERQNTNKRAELYIKLSEHARGQMRVDLLNEAANQLTFPISQSAVFSASQIADQIGVDPYTIGKWGQILGLKAPRGGRNFYGYWDGGRFMYNENALKRFTDEQNRIINDEMVEE